MNERLKRWTDNVLAAMPFLLFSAIFILLLVLKSTAGLVLPVWGCWGLGLLWSLMAWGYVISFNILKRIGGLAVIGCAVIILSGSLIPRGQVGAMPGRTSERVVRQMESSWNALTSGDVFVQISLKEGLLDYGRSLATMDPFRAGQVILFALFGFSLAVCFLFPLNPVGGLRKVGRERSGVEGGAAENVLLPTSPKTQLAAHDSQVSARAYTRRGCAVLLGGTLFGVQAELLQVLSATREVTFLSMFESAAGVLAGLVVFVPVHMVYTFCAQQKSHEGRFNVLGVGVDAVSMGDCIQLFRGIIESDQKSAISDQRSGDNKQKSGIRGQQPGLTSDLRPLTSVRHSGSAAMTSALGVAGIVEARRNPRLQRILNESVLNTPDGMPLVWLGKLFGYKNIDRVYGPDLLRDVCAFGADKGWKHFFYGAAPGVVERLKAQLEAKHPSIDIAGIYCPPFRPLTEQEEADLIARVAACQPDIFWVGISTPKQLYFMDQMKDKLACKIICPVGYAFDVNAGVEQDAPDWIKYAGLQWLHRAIKQPRLWKRYLPDNPRFMFEVLLQIFRLKKYPLFTHERPLKPFTDAEGYIRYPVGVTSVSAMTLQSAVERVANWIATGQSHYVNVCTADTMVQCFDRPDMAKLVSEAGMATTDGMPLMLQGKLRGYEVTRVYGPDLVLALCERGLRPQGGEKSNIQYSTRNVQCSGTGEGKGLTTRRPTEDWLEPAKARIEGNGNEHESTRKECRNAYPTEEGSVSLMPDAECRVPVSEAGFRHYFYGSTEEVLDKLKANLLAKYPDLQIVGMYSPPFRPLTEAEEDEVAEMINATKPDIVWCGLGTPKQDYWVAKFQPKVNAAAFIAVGAAFNFHAGEVKQAPRWMMRLSLEWLFRLVVEPKRLWKRYLVGNPRFVMLCLRQLWAEFRYGR